MKALIRIQSLVPVTIKKKGEWFIAKCEQFDVVTQGRTEKAAKRNLESAIMEFFKIVGIEESYHRCSFKLKQIKIFTDAEMENMRSSCKLYKEHLKKYSNVNPKIQNELAKESL